MAAWCCRGRCALLPVRLATLVALVLLIVLVTSPARALSRPDDRVLPGLRPAYAMRCKSRCRDQRQVNHAKARRPISNRRSDHAVTDHCALGGRRFRPRKTKIGDARCRYRLRTAPISKPSILSPPQFHLNDKVGAMLTLFARVDAGPIRSHRRRNRAWCRYDRYALKLAMAASSPLPSKPRRPWSRIENDSRPCDRRTRATWPLG